MIDLRNTWMEINFNNQALNNMEPQNIKYTR